MIKENGKKVVIVSLCLSLFVSNLCFAQSDSKKEVKRVDVKKLKKQYWSQEDSYDVVQNRLYSKSGRFEFELYGGAIFTDPFLSVNNLGGLLGYHFTEFLGVELVGWKSFSKASRALEIFQSEIGATTNYNEPKWFLGVEASFSLIYGKLSLLGKSILYYDLHLLGGLGATDTESGRNFTILMGLGQQIYISSMFALRMDYRLSYYKETILERVQAASLGEAVAERTNWSNIITVGLSMFLF